MHTNHSSVRLLASYRTVAHSLKQVVLASLFMNNVGSLEQTPDNSPKTSADVFAAYTSCRFDDGLSVVETAPLANGIAERTVKTILGSEQIPMTAGRRLMFAYPEEDFYANTKVEILPAISFEHSKKALVANFEYILASGDNSRNYHLKHKLNGFEIQGLDRTKREGVLGIYLLLDNDTRTAITIYFLNQEPPKRFKSMEEYTNVRDHFLTAYTACVRTSLDAHP